jgi:hypothetical protein
MRDAAGSWPSRTAPAAPAPAALGPSGRPRRSESRWCAIAVAPQAEITEDAVSPGWTEDSVLTGSRPA